MAYVVLSGSEECDMSRENDRTQVLLEIHRALQEYDYRWYVRWSENLRQVLATGVGVAAAVWLLLFLVVRPHSGFLYVWISLVSSWAIPTTIFVSTHIMNRTTMFLREQKKRLEQV